MTNWLSRYLTPEEFEDTTKIVGSANIVRDANEFIDKSEEHMKKLVQTMNSLDKDITNFEKKLYSNLSVELNKVANLKTAVSEIDKLVQEYRNEVFMKILKNARILMNLDLELMHLAETVSRQTTEDAMDRVEIDLGIVKTSITDIESKIKKFKDDIKDLKSTTLKSLGEDFGRDLVSNLFLDSKKITDDLEDHFKLLNSSRADIEKHMNLLKPLLSRP